MKTRLGIVAATVALVAAGAVPAAAQDDDVTVSLARFFGDCDDTTQGVTDVSQATTECEVIQILTNAFNAEDNGITVEKLGGQNWGDYYPQLSTTFSAGDPPDVAVMHQHRLPDFAGRGLLMPLGDALAEAGVDFSDYTQPAQDAATADGEIFALPFDIHASLWHVNVDLMAEAGLVDDAGMPIMPTSADELLAQCQAVQEATGKQYFGHDWFEFGVGARLFLGLVWQQGGDLYDGAVATVNTPEGQEAVRLLNELATTCSDPAQGYTDSQQGFLNGDIAVLHNGTWVVDQYDRETEFEYMATDLPNIYGTPAAWGDSHMWVLPNQSDQDPASHGRVDRVPQVPLRARRRLGHRDRPHRRRACRSSRARSTTTRRSGRNYAGTADIAGLVPAVQGWAGAWDASAEELNATWVAGKDQAQALADAEARMNEELD